MKLLLILLSLILICPILYHFLAKKLHPDFSTTIYSPLSHIFVLAILLSQWVMLPVYMLQQLAIGFLVFSLSYAICKISQWHILANVMLGLMFIANLFLLAMAILLA